MSGLVASARQWRSYEKRTRKLFAKHRVKTFHATDVRRGSGDFEGWTVDKKLRFLDEFGTIINETVELMFNAVMLRADYQYYCKLDWPKGRKDSEYAILGRAVAAAAIDGVANCLAYVGSLEPALHLVFESGHENSGDIVRVYDEIVKHVGSNKALSSLSFQDKSASLPLAAADYQAYTCYRLETKAKPIGFLKGPSKADASYRKNAYRIPLGRRTLLALNQQAKDLARKGVS